MPHPWAEKPGRATAQRVARVRHNLAITGSNSIYETLKTGGLIKGMFKEVT